MAKESEIVLFHSDTAGVVPTSSQLIKGEIALNTADGRLFTENASATVIELGINPTTVTTGAIVATSITASGVVTANSSLASSNLVATGGTVNGVVIGATTASAITGTVVTASTNFVGALTGSVTGNLVGNTSGGTHTGPVVGNVTASSGTTTLHDLVINGTVDFNAAELTDIGTPTADTSAATRGYVTTQINNLINSAPAALDTLAELSSALGDDANFSTTITNSIATKLPLAGGTMSGAVAMGSNKITGLTSGTASGDAVNKGQLDAMLPLAGGTLTGNLDVGSNSVSSSHTPGSANDLTNKSYVDGLLGSATAAATSAAAALVSENNAATSEVNAASSAASSASSSTSAASSLADFNTKYLGAHATAPTGTAAGQQYFNTTSDTMFVYTGSSWTEAGSAVNGTSNRVVVTATAAQTNFSISYDVGYVDVYLNGSKLQAGTDFTATNGATVVLTSGAAAGDIVDMVAYGAFNVANVYTQTESDARFAQLSNNLSDLPSASTALTNLGVTSTAAELNVLDGIPATLTPTEIGYVDGVTSAIQTQLDAKGTVSNLADLSITSTAAELNKLDAVSRGSLIYGNPSAETAILTKGTANQVLTSDGTDIAWADAGGGGAWTLLSSTTASASSQIDFTNIDSTYDDYMIVINNYYASSSSYLKARLKIDGSFRTDSNYWTVAAKFGKYNFEAPSAGGTSDFWKSNRYSDSIRFLSESSNMYENSSAPQKFILYLQDVNRAGTYKTIWGNMLVYDGSGTRHFYVPVHGAYAESAGGSNTNLAACTGIRFYPSTGTITAAVFKIYGLAKS